MLIFWLMAPMAAVLRSWREGCVLGYSPALWLCGCTIQTTVERLQREI
jgi:hypothetical protein